MKTYLLLLFLCYSVPSQSAIKIPIKKIPREYTPILPHKEQSRWKRDDTGKNKLVFVYDPATYGMIGIGTPMQFIPTLFDTYSTKIWFFNSECTSDVCLITNKFDANKSNSSSTWGPDIKHTYKDLKLIGPYSVDTFLLGDLLLNRLSYVDVMRTTWNGTRKRLGTQSYAGQISLRVPIKSSGTDFLAQLVLRKLVVDTVFGLKIPSKMKRDEIGELYIGDWERNYVNESSIKWIDIISTAYWEFIVDKMVYGSYSLGENADVLIDTGVSMIVGPRAIVQNLYESIGNSVDITPITVSSFLSEFDGYAVKCTEKLSNIDFLINNTHYVLTPEDYLLPFDGQKGMCVFGISPANSNNTDFWRLGDVFLSKYYTICEGKLSRLSFNDYK